MAFEYCANHPQSMAAWRCDHCGRHYCAQCLVVDSDFSTVKRCRKCGRPCRELTPGERPLTKRSFPGMLTDAFVYPFRGRGKFILAAFAVFALIASLLQYLPSPGGLFGGVLKQALGFAVGLIVSGWLFAYSFEIIGTSAKGQREPPEGPQLRSQEDFTKPLLLTIGVVVSSLIPYITYRFLLVHYVEPMRGIGVALLVFAVLYLPMALTAAALWHSAAGLNPILIIGSMLKAGPGYFLAPLVVAALCGTLWVAANFLSIPIPLIGPVVEGFVYCVGVLYCIMTVMRICGLIYYAYEDRLGWFPD